MGGGAGLGFGLLMMIGLVLIVVVVVWALLGGVSGRTGDQKSSQAPSSSSELSARELLDQRYARGEIDDEDYERRKRAMGSD
ncbi:SHOCT domain-containing protein [Nocardioidaceae bacterium]|nr:SHOCT domain-containing protein [Nocardioidaceae bacterium]